MPSGRAGWPCPWPEPAVARAVAVCRWFILNKPLEEITVPYKGACSSPHSGRFFLRGAFGHRYHLCSYRHPVYNNSSSKSFADQSHSLSLLVLLRSDQCCRHPSTHRPANSSLQLGMVLQLRR